MEALQELAANNSHLPEVQEAAAAELSRRATPDPLSIRGKGQDGLTTLRNTLALAGHARGAELLEAYRDVLDRLPPERVAELEKIVAGKP